MFKLKDLPFNPASFEPSLDEETMIIHYKKHHQGYIDKLNKTLEKYPELSKKDIIELLINLEDISEEIRLAVKNFAGGVLNHDIFWQSLASQDNQKNISVRWREMINNNFSSLENLLELLEKESLALFGSGWVWLVKDSLGGLRVIKTINQDTPWALDLKPLLAIDLWEHAYYLKYRADRPSYVKNILQLLNHQEAERKYFE